jgi:Protein kinase domain
VNDKQWKLTDFGISAQATAVHSLTTERRRGTGSYCAPEILQDHPTFSNNVDIWGLGCLLYELVTGQIAFKRDWNTMQYATSFDAVLELPSQPVLGFLSTHISESLKLLLHRHQHKRPSATFCRKLFHSYAQLLNIDLVLVVSVIALSEHPSFSEWTQVMCGDASSGTIYPVVHLYEGVGEVVAAASLSEAIMKRRVLDMLGQSTIPLALSDENWQGDVFRDYLADAYMAEKEYECAAEIYRTALLTSPLDFVLWHKLCDVYVAAGRVEHAISICCQANPDHQDFERFNLSAAIELANLHALKEDYALAIHCWEIITLGFLFVMVQGDLRPWWEKNVNAPFPKIGRWRIGTKSWFPLPLPKLHLMGKAQGPRLNQRT